jgi:hypothetical protein
MTPVPKAKNDLPIPYISESFSLDKASPSGLTWRERPLAHFGNDKRIWKGWNTRFAGKPAGTLGGIGYWHVGLAINGQERHVLVHRIVFALVNSQWPGHDIDHRDLNRAVNRFGNLREATDGENKQNTGLRSTNTSGFKGVSWDKRDRKWIAEVTVNKRKVYRGRFGDVFDALMARRRAERQHHPFRLRPSRRVLIADEARARWAVV